MVAARQYLTVRACILFQIILLFQLPLFVFAAEEQPATLWEITADEITHEKKTDSIIAEGAVVIKQHDEQTPDSMVIQADWIQYNTTLKTVRALDNLVISTGGDEIKAQKALIDLGEQTGIFHNAVIFRAPNNLYLNGTTIQKTGDNAYWIKDGSLTSCKTQAGEAPPWAIHSKDSQITPGGYARLKHVTFRVKKIPILYLPYLLVSTNKERKSGLLFPEISQSKRDGFGLLVPVFVNLAPYSDFTLYPGYLTKRGAVAGAEFRFMSDYQSYGALALNYLNDETVDTPDNDYKSDGILRTNHHRYWVRGKADHVFTNGAVGRADIDIVSDQDYLQEYRKGLIGYRKSNDDFLKFFQRGFQSETITHRENSLQISKIWSSMDLQGEILIINDASNQETATSPLWALPRLNFSGLVPVQRTPLSLSWESEYVNYWREKGIGTHRLDFHPRILSPLNITPYLETNFSVGVRETLYLPKEYGGVEKPPQWQDKRIVSRTLFDYEIETNTTLFRDYIVNDKNGLKFRHIFRPGLGYNYISAFDQDDLPNLDSSDRIAKKRLLSYWLDNYMGTVPADGAFSLNKKYGSLKFSQIYDFDRDETPFSDVLIKLDITPYKNLRLQYETSISMYDQGVTHHYLTANFSHQRGHSLTVEYRYVKYNSVVPPYFFAEPRGDGVHQLNAGIESRLTKSLAAKFYMEHSLITNEVIDATLSLNYHPSCWGLELVAYRSPDDRSLMAIFSLEGIGGTLPLGIPGL